METKKEQENVNTMNTTMASTEKKPNSVGKRKVHVIPSRYMQKKTDESIVHKGSTPVMSTTMPSKGSGARPKTFKKNLIVTPKVEVGSLKIHSSTPTKKSPKLQGFENCNISSVTLLSKMPAIPSMKTALGPTFNEESKITNLRKFHGSPGKMKPKAVRPTQAITTQISSTIPIKNKTDADNTQNFDLLYSKEVLMAYRLQEKKDVLEKNINDSLALLWGLNMRNAELMKEETALVNELQLKTHQLNLHNFLTKQNEELMKTVPDYSEVQKNLSAISNSLDKCQSEIPVHNVSLPQKEDDLIGYMEVLNSSLTEILEGNETLRNKLHNLVSVLPDIRSSFSSADIAMSRSQEIASKLNQLSNKEASIIIQRIQEMSLEDTKGHESYKFL